MRNVFSIVAAVLFTAILLSFDFRNVPVSSDVSHQVVTTVPLEISAPDLVPSIEPGHSWRMFNIKQEAIYKPNCVYYPCYTDWLGRRVRIVVCSENGNIDAPYIEPCPGGGNNIN